MKTSKQIEEDFRVDLQALLTKHKVKIRAANQGWPIYDDYIHMTAIIHPEWNPEGELVSEGAKIDLGDLLEFFPPSVVT